MQEKFEKLETELREEVGVLKAQAPPRFSEVVARSRREQTLTVANLQQQEPETGLAPRLEGRRRVGRKGGREMWTRPRTYVTKLGGQ